IAAMLGWLSDASVRASRRKRASRSGSRANSRGKVLMATSRPSLLSCARYTSPMPPEPNGDTIRYGPNSRPSRDWAAASVTVVSSSAGLSRKLPACSACKRSSSTCRCRSVSPLQATSRNAWRASGSRSRAAWKSPFTLRQRSSSIAESAPAFQQSYSPAELFTDALATPTGVTGREGHTRLLADKTFRQGFAVLSRLGLSDDVSLYHPQINEVTDLAGAFPDTRIVLDHVGGVLGIGAYRGKRDEVFSRWAASIKALAARPNVFVKLGGLGQGYTGLGFNEQAEPPSSEMVAARFRPYIQTCIEAFGASRCMFESNFPVDKISYSYPVFWNACKLMAKGASSAEKADLFAGSAARCYRLDAIRSTAI